MPGKQELDRTCACAGVTLEGVGFYLVRQGKFVGWTLQRLIPALTGSKSTTIEHLRRGFKGSISKALYR
jgi:hypothetical protein